MDPKKIGIIGGGISGLLACKYALQKGFVPTVFEARDCIGGVWSYNTIHSTKLQTPKDQFQFSDFGWPDSDSDSDFPHHTQVLNYITSYALHFHILPHIKFNNKVLSIDYSISTTTSPEEEEEDEDDEIHYMSSWKLWGGSGQAFSLQGGMWSVIVQDTLNSSSPDSYYKEQEYQFDFVILCIGKYSDLPNIPQFPINQGPEVFQGTVLHSMDYAAMDSAAELVKDKGVTVIGFQKSAMDIAAEISKLNGIKHPCTLLFRTAHWSVPENLVVHIFRNLNRFSELMVHKPNEGFLLWLLALALSPLLWIFSKVVESYLKWIYPLAEYNMVPEHPFLTQIRSCMLTVLPPNFYDRVREGSLILKKSQTFSFCEKGLIAGNEDAPPPLETDIVIFATGYASELKLGSIFKSTDHFQKCLTASSPPLYRECIHPKIPQLAILGYSDSHATLYTTEMRAKWLACFLEGNFRLPTIKEMKDDVMRWENCLSLHTGRHRFYKPSCVSVMLQIHCNDEICKDMNRNPRRKRTYFSELFAPYGPSDYANIETSTREL